MQSPYTTTENVYNYLGLTPPSESSAEAIQMESWILGMSRFIDNYTKRKIWTEEETSIKYDGDGTDLLVIKDCIDPVVTLDGAEIEVLKYPTTKEYTSRIVLDDGYRFTKGRQNVEVTALQCMALYLPEDVQLACTVLVAGVYNAKNVQGKVGTTERMGNYQVTYRDEAQKADFESAKTILAGYRRIVL